VAVGAIMDPSSAAPTFMQGGGVPGLRRQRLRHRHRAGGRWRRRAVL